MLPELVTSTTQGQIHSENDVNGKRHIKSVRNHGIPQLHNLPCSSNEVQSISTAFKKWQTSAPTLHQYRPDEIEVVIHRRTGKVDRVKRHQDQSKLESSSTRESTFHKDACQPESFHPPDIQYSEHRSMISNFHDHDMLGPCKESSPSPLMFSDDQVTTEDRNESFVSSLDDRSNDNDFYVDEDDDEQMDCQQCRLLKHKLDETIEQVNARQNLIVTLTSLNNNQLEVGRRLENEIKELNQRLMNTELVYSQNIRTIRESLQLVSKKNVLPVNPLCQSQESSNELRLQQLIDKGRNAFAVDKTERGDPDGMDCNIVKNTSLEKIQLALTNMSNHLDSLNN